MLSIGTQRILGQLIASQIAYASAASFLFVWTYGFTYCGAISRSVAVRGCYASVPLFGLIRYFSPVVRRP
jgi:hypothetical protein